jgi:conjugative transposon TraK protein
MFPKTRNIELSFRYIRLVSIVAIAGSFLAGIIFFFLAARVMLTAQSRVYILSAGKAMEAFASDGAGSEQVFARWQVVNFHTDFFSLEPDERFNERGLRRALYLADGSAKRVYDDLKENGYFSGVVSGNVSQWLEVDSVVLRMTGYPFYFRCYATETITRPTSRVIRNLVTEGYLRRVHRSDNNLYGFLIERWTVLENKDIKIEQR